MFLLLICFIPFNVLVVKESHKITYIVVFCKFLAAPVAKNNIICMN